MDKEKILSLHVYTDGGSRGNPGNGAIAFAIYDDKGKLLKEKSESIGICTNNVAEYKALIAALEEASNYCQGEIFCFSDSEFMVKQLNGKNKVRKKHIKKLYLKVKDLEKTFESVIYSHLPRENSRISKADRLVNKELNSQLRKK